jgi:3-oxoacyl-[acyl-carrier-protein] synthase III
VRTRSVLAYNADIAMTYCLHMHAFVYSQVYKFATREVPNVLTEALNNAGLTVDDVDFLLLHQANIRIMEAVAQRLGIPMEKVLLTTIHIYKCVYIYIYISLYICILNSKCGTV